MSNENSISLSQAEVDRLLGISAKSDEKKEAQTFTRQTIASDQEIEKFRAVMMSFTTKLRSHFKKMYSEPGIRKIVPSAIEQISRAEFMSHVDAKDFLFLVEINRFEVLLKLDSFLFCALSGITFNANTSSNRFQNETVRMMVAPIIIGNLLKAADRLTGSKVKINPLYELPKLEGLKTDTAGISATFTWNEGFKSLGVEKFFFQRDFLDYIIGNRPEKQNSVS